MATEETTDKKQPVSLTWESDANQFIVFDATLSEGHTGRSEITSFPVEGGSDHTDHIRRLRDELSLVVAVADNQILRANQVRTPANTGGEVGQRSVSAYNFLVQSKNQGKLVAVFTTLRTYRNMAIESIDVTRDANTSQIIQANLQLKEILIATTERVDAPEPSKTRAAPARNKKKNRGKQNTTEASEANKAKGRETSVALKGLEALGISL